MTVLILIGILIFAIYKYKSWQDEENRKCDAMRDHAKIMGLRSHLEFKHSIKFKRLMLTPPFANKDDLLEWDKKMDNQYIEEMQSFGWKLKVDK